MISELLDEARKAAQNVLAFASALATITAVMASAYVLGFEGLAIVGSFITGCGAACAPGALYQAIEKEFSRRSVAGLVVSIVPAVIVAALFAMGVSGSQGGPRTGELIAPASAAGKSASAATGRHFAPPALFAALREARARRIGMKRKGRRR